MVPDPVDCPLHLVDKHFIEPIPGKEGGRRNHPSCTCFVCNVSKEALSDADLGDSYKPIKYTSYWCPICKCTLYMVILNAHILHKKYSDSKKHWQFRMELVKHMLSNA